jgi:hypothetical protein
MIVLRRRFLLYVALFGGLCSAPTMAAALAGVIHDRQGTDNREHNRSEYNC